MKQGHESATRSFATLSLLGRSLKALGLLAQARHARRALGRGIASAAELQKRRNLTQLQAFEGTLNRNGFSLQEFTSILDFGCGEGRLTQNLSRLAPQAQVFGCDIDADAVSECRLACPQSRISVIKPEPPLEFEDEQFDFIFSYSVFTSLSEANHEVWLKDLARTLRPGGVMLHTTHSYENLRRLTMFCPQILDNFKLPKPVDEFIRSGPRYYYVPYGPASPDYGLAIISQEYVMEKWPQFTGLRLAEYAVAAMEGYPHGPQDFVLMVKKPVQGHL